MEPLTRDAELAGNRDKVAMVLSLLNRRHSFMMREMSREAKL